MSTSDIITRLETWDEITHNDFILVETTHLEKLSATSKGYSRRFYKMTKINKKSAWLVEVDKNGNTLFAPASRWARKSIPRTILVTPELKAFEDKCVKLIEAWQKDDHKEALAIIPTLKPYEVRKLWMRAIDKGLINPPQISSHPVSAALEVA